MMILAFLSAAASAPTPISLAEARALSPSALADRLLPGQVHGPMVDAIVNGRGGLTPPSSSVNRVWLVERMVPFDATLCRSHIFHIDMAGDDPAANAWRDAVPTHPVKVDQYDRLWVPPGGKATETSCAAAPARESGFGVGRFSLRQAADLVEQARAAFAPGARADRFRVDCKGDRGACGADPRATLAAIDWSALGFVEEVEPADAAGSVGDPQPKDAPRGRSHVQFTFPYAAGGATWVITVERSPKIVTVRMEAQTIIYE